MYKTFVILTISSFMSIHSTQIFSQHLPLSTASIDTPVTIEGKKNFFRAGQFFFSGQPNEETFRWLQNEGVTVVFNLRTDKEMETLTENKFDEIALLQELGIDYVHIPMGGSDGYSPQAVDSLGRTLARYSGKALIHCASAGRVSYLWTAYLVNYRGLTIDEAIEMGKKIKLYLPPLEELLGFPLTVQRDLSLHKAVRNGNSAQVFSLLMRKSKLINAKDENGYSPLHWATNSGHTDIMENLISNGADIHAQDSDGDTPLHWAAYSGQKSATETLLNSGADIHRTNKNGDTPIHYAAQIGHRDIVDQLITAHANINATEMCITNEGRNRILY